MNEFDQFVKHKLKAEYYIRYADGFVIFSRGKEWLRSILSDVRFFSQRTIVSRTASAQNIHSHRCLWS